ncbi:MAG: DUF6588 family protein [Marinilabilia sp.]
MNLLKKSIVVLFALSIGFSASSQEPVSNFVQLMNDAPADAKTVSKAYLKPYGEMLGTSLNGGWYNTAKVHGVLGFDLTVSVMNSVVPSSAQTFDLDDLGLQSFQPVDESVAPTVAGDMENLPQVELDPEVSGDEITLPNGSGYDNLPVPMVQAAVGLPRDIEVIGRFLPSRKVGDAGEVSLIGGGLKHSLKGYIPFVKRVPFLQMSVMAGYTSFNSTTSIPGTAAVDVTDGELDISSGAFTSRLLLGVNLPVVAVYTGVGYGTANSDFDVNGEYTVSAIDQSFTDPFSLGYKTSGVDLNAGVRFRIGFLALHADYTVGEYSTLTAGVGINIR